MAIATDSLHAEVFTAPAARSAQLVVAGRVLIVLALLAVVLCLLAAQPAYAWKEGDATSDIDWTDCDTCHTEQWPPFETRQGPHGRYSVTTNRCGTCHSVHAASGLLLLGRETIQDSCWVCHDGSGGYGVYGTIVYRGLTVGAAHRIDTASIVPGGDPSTGGSSTVTFGGQNGHLSCDDCHSPHDAKTVAPYRPERVRFHATDQGTGAPDKPWSTSHLLKQRPSGSVTTATVYGSDWCLGCHKGRDSGGAVHNHPVDSLATTSTPFYFDNVAIVTTDTSFETTMGTMGMLGASTPNLIWHNRGYVMPYPRTAQQAGHAPICQQCHADARGVGAVGSVTHSEVYRYGDGQKEDASTPTDTPLFQTFPHESQGARFLVESNDDLCTNCHPANSLP